MSGFLLDTDVISMLSPSRTGTSPRFLDWLERMDAEGRVFLCVVSVHEIEKGIALLEKRQAVAKAAALRGWLAGLTIAFADQILGFGTEAAVLSGRQEAQALARGTDPGMADAVIAGIAQAHALTIVSRNAKHFRPFGVAVLTPEEVAA